MYIRFRAGREYVPLTSSVRNAMQVEVCSSIPKCRNQRGVSVTQWIHTPVWLTDKAVARELVRVSILSVYLGW